MSRFFVEADEDRTERDFMITIHKKIEDIKRIAKRVWMEILFSERGSISFDATDQDTGLPTGSEQFYSDDEIGNDVPDGATSQQAQQEDDFDPDAPLFEYNAPDGTKAQLAAKDILDLLSGKDQLTQLQKQNAEYQERLKILETVNPLLRGQQQGQQQQAQQQGQPGQISREQEDEYLAGFGNRIAAMLEGEEGGPAALGRFVRDAFMGLAQEAVRSELSQHTQQNTVEQAFLRDYPDFKQTIQEDKGYQQFMRENRGYEFNPIEGMLAYKLSQAQQQIDALKSGTDKARQEGARQGEQQTIKNLRARGTIRQLGGAQSASRGVTAGRGKYDLSDPDQRTQAMVEGLQRLRSQGSA